MQVIACQLDMVWENKAKNHQRVIELLSQSNIEPGSLIILPEMFDTGFSMNVSATAQSELRESEQVLQELARTYQSAVMGGVVSPAVEQLLGGQPTGKYVAGNEAVVFGPDGAELCRYRKQQPFSLSGEDQNYPAGKRHVLFEWQGVKIAPFICYDLRFPELFRAAIRDGAELLTLIACWPAVRSEHWVRLLQARAIENLALTVGVNRCGHEPNLAFDGRSAAFDHLGNFIFQADGTEQVVSCRLDVEAMRAWREKFPALRDGHLSC